MATWHKCAGEKKWVNLDSAEAVEVKPRLIGAMTQEEWYQSPWFAATARMISGAEELLDVGQDQDKLVRWVETLIATPNS